MLERTFGLIKAGPIDRHQLPTIMRAIQRSHLRIVTDYPFGDNIADGDGDRFRQLYAEHAGRPYYDGLIESVARGSVAMVLEGPNAVALWRDMLGPSDPVRARREKPQSLRAIYGGTAMPDNGFHGSDSFAAAEREIAIFFPELM